MAKWIGWNFVAILIMYVFLPKWNLKIFQAVVAGFQTLVPTFTYWDLVTPFYMLIFFVTFWMWLRPSSMKGPR